MHVRIIIHLFFYNKLFSYNLFWFTANRGAGFPDEMRMSRGDSRIFILGGLSPQWGYNNK